MLKNLVVAAIALQGAAALTAQQPPAASQQAAAASETKSMSGMSILGNQEAPKSLVIVPWKSAEIGRASCRERV